jgi:thiol-disulfide isomerase/thioredoxin
MSFRSLVICLAFSSAMFGLSGCNQQAIDGDSTGSSAGQAESTTGVQETADTDSSGTADETADPPEVSLTVGDLAPPLTLGKWVKGDPVEEFENGQVYVVEFWATWCGPCRVSMPHISQLQTEYGDKVRFIGVSDETESEVSSFLEGVQDQESGKTWNEVVTYGIALDNEDKNTSKSYMQAAKQGGIPTAFIIGKEGHIEWIGHPMSMDEPLASVVDGNWDRAAARAEFQLGLKQQDFRMRVLQLLGNPQTSGDTSKLEALVAEGEQLGLPASFLHSIQFDVALMTGKFADAQAAADELAKLTWDRAPQLNALAWNLVTRVPKENQNHEQALKIAQRASELTNNQDASVLDTLARVYFEAGDVQQAVEWQRKAVALAPEPQLQETLTQYEEKLSKSTDDDSAQSDAPTDLSEPGAPADSEGEEPRP